MAVEAKITRQVSMLTSLKCQHILPAFGNPTEHGLKRSEFQTWFQTWLCHLFAVWLWTDILTSVNLEFLGHRLQIEYLSCLPLKISPG